MEIKFRSEECAEALAYFCKRMTFEVAHKLAHGENSADREKMAYQIIYALRDVEQGLNEAGYCPR